MRPTAARLLTGYGSRTLSRARSYVRAGRVLDIDADEDAESLMAHVRGTRPRPYEVTVEWDSGYADGVCTCPVGLDCKHAAAAVMAYFEAGLGTARRMTRARSALAPQKAPDRVDLALTQWLERLAQVQRVGAAAASPSSKEAVLYLLDVKTWPGLPCLRVTLCKGRRRKDGSFGGVQQYNPQNAILGRAPGFVRDEDRELFFRLAQAEREMVSSHYLLSRAGNANLLPRLIETGRCYWETADSRALKPGKPRQGRWRWVLDETGGQRLTPASGSGVQALPVAPPWYLDTTRGTCGPLHTGLPDTLALTLLQTPRLTPERAVEFREKLNAALPSLVPQPSPITVETRKDCVPAPTLRLGAAGRVSQHWYGNMAGAWAELGFDYEGDRIAAADERSNIERMTEGRLVRMERNRKAESAAGKAFDGFIPFYENEAGVPKDAVTLGNEDEDWLDFIVTVLPRLEREGWQIEFEPEFPLLRASDRDFELDIQEGEDWFGVGLGIEVDGGRVDLLPLLVEALAALPRRLRTAEAIDETRVLHVPLGDGRSLAVPTERLKPILSVLIELFDRPPLTDDGRLRLNRLDAARLAELDGAEGLHWRGGKAIKALAEKLENFRGIRRTAVPRTFCGQLRDYQRDGLDWLQFLRHYEFGGILADDMGLGKTIQALAHLLAEKRSRRNDRPSLLVVPTSLVHNWQREAARFAPSLRVLILHGPERAERFAEIARQDVVITTYPLLPRDAEVLTKQPWHYAILDEAQVIKNPRTQAARIAYELGARHRLCLTGTPMENHLGEMWSLFRFLMPGYLGDSSQFRRLYRTPIETHNDTERREHLARRVRPFLLRRTKDAVAPELPPKTEMVQSVELEGLQCDLYESVRLAMHKKVRDTVRKKGFARSQIEILEALLRLRQVCCDPRLLKSKNLRRTAPSAKLNRLEELLPALLEEGRRVLLFSQFTEMLALIQELVERHGIAFTKLTGRTRNRAAAIEKFQKRDVPLMLVSLKAGGVGLNLTAADTVIHYDPWWNPAVESQATDRAHRIGQDKPVFVYKLICAGTVEERIQAMQARKQALLDGVYAKNQNQPTAAFGRAELEALFEPL